MGFAYTYDVGEIFGSLSVPGAEEAARLMADNARSLEDHLALVLQGQRGVATITTATGGVTVDFTKAFKYAPVVHVSFGEATAGRTCNSTSITTTAFKIQCYDPAGAELNGTAAVVNWVALY